MQKAYYDSSKHKDQGHDDVLPKLIDKVKDQIINHDDDILYCIIGMTGTGKSMLGLHIHELYMGEEASADYIALEQSTYAKVYGEVIDKPQPRIAVYDEGNVNRRSSLSKFNKSIMDLFMKNRDLNIFHLWATPSLQQLDQYFVKERIRGVFYCPSRTGNIRPYYFISRNRMLQILKKYNSLDENLLRKVVKSYALYKGWYKDYQGPIRPAYNELKKSEAYESSKEWTKTWTKKKEENLTSAEVTQELGISSDSLRRYKREGLTEGEDYTMSEAGRYLYTPQSIDKLRQIMRENYKRRKAGMFSNGGGPK